VPIDAKTSERDEIKRRIEAFRVQQRRFAREREDYAAEVIARMQKPEPKTR